MSVYPVWTPVPGAESPIWQEDGEPANLTAAATDALEWLRYFLPTWDPHQEIPEGECPLRAAIEALERYSGATYCPDGVPPEGSVPLPDPEVQP